MLTVPDQLLDAVADARDELRRAELDANVEAIRAAFQRLTDALARAHSAALSVQVLSDGLAALGIPWPGIAPPPPPTVPTSYQGYHPSGITIEFNGDRPAAVEPIPQTGRLQCSPGCIVSWSGTGVEAKLGMAADGRIVWLPLPLAGMATAGAIPWHEQVPPLARRTLTMHAGDRLLVGKARQRSDDGDPIYLEQVVLVECGGLLAYGAADSRWPNRIRGATSAMVADFLGKPFAPEFRAGWSGRYTHPERSWPNYDERGYGGDFAEWTGLGALLLCSELGAFDKAAIEFRMRQVADDLSRFGIAYEADGGHGIGRYFPWLVGRARGDQLPAGGRALVVADFAEREHLFRRADGSVDWRHNRTHNVGPVSTKGDGSQAELYRITTANQWAGAGVAAFLCPWLIPFPEFAEYTIAHLREQAPKLGTGNAWHFASNLATRQLLELNRAILGV